MALEIDRGDLYTPERIGNFVVYPQMWREDPRLAAREYYQHQENVGVLTHFMGLSNQETRMRMERMVSESEMVMERIREVCPNADILAAEHHSMLNRLRDESQQFFVDPRDLNVPPDFSLTGK